MYSSKIVTAYWLVYLNEKLDEVIVDYERYNCCIDIFEGILKGLRHDDILNGCFRWIQCYCH